MIIPVHSSDRRLEIQKCRKTILMHLWKELGAPIATEDTVENSGESTARAADCASYQKIISVVTLQKIKNLLRQEVLKKRYSLQRILLRVRIA